MRIDPTNLVQLRRDLMKRGQVLATLLADVLGGRKSVNALAALGIGVKPGLRPDEALRLALDQIEARRKMIDNDDDRFGRCDVCGDDLGLPALGEMPWADRCRAHRAD